ncbi:tRNA (N6-threonylcarbamoyladenosine(37)-N6)-methyltransferase TrmO [Desulforhopalus singaporensis]|uniref:tRNA-Thr(GGU) m(6)t(6)A37 methyltransferase TsaA n=1 Tax=Desulforhopalus singaporensis TaxID=91360 RepID=A0A1H0KSS1_9BACT|nr:tRNA (N6-threonylcarbamoyladenosine(37)-N6)-methyltransferase TrmO [Desulforhopalus singaporensis]SDO58833.1 tRNA-Thr(GGU) m(6)t(6)A37 methyltransferase TsaA [Desulforhopalus singaporensis]
MKIVAEQIGVIHSCFTEKFGIPRQPGMVKSSVAELELISPYNREEMVRGLDQFSHVWIHFVFHTVVCQGWKSMVRPPWLGGKKKVGVFGCRTPHRPNHLGLSAVRLEGIEVRKSGPVLLLSGIDLLDGTPVIDIKPYVPYCDKIDDAVAGYADGAVPGAEVVFSDSAVEFCNSYRLRTGRDIKTLIAEMIRQDPRPAIQKNSEKSSFGMLLWDVNVRFQVTGADFFVESCHMV